MSAVSRSPLRFALALACFASAPRSARAHDFRPALLELRETAPGRFAVKWRPGTLPPSITPPRPRFPAHCNSDGATLDCGARGLSGDILIDGLAGARIDALVHVHLLSGPGPTAVLRADAPALTVGDTAISRPARGVRVGSYLVLGVRHILGGFDHLLFLLGLLLLVRDLGALVRTVTAFTVAHSLTLAAVALGGLRLPPEPVEAAIALSVLLLATELSRPVSTSEGPTLARRHPWLIAFAFGLLHGFGFAGALLEVGLPQGQAVPALLAFNLGVELGQLAVAAAVVIAVSAIRRYLPRLAAHAPRFRLASIYALGALAAAWLLERVIALGGPA